MWITLNPVYTRFLLKTTLVWITGLLGSVPIRRRQQGCFTAIFGSVFHAIRGVFLGPDGAVKWGKYHSDFAPVSGAKIPAVFSDFLARKVVGVRQFEFGMR